MPKKHCNFICLLIENKAGYRLFKFTISWKTIKFMIFNELLIEELQYPSLTW